MSFNLADIFEMAVDAYADREYIVADGKRCSYAQMEARANQLAHYLGSKGIGPGDHVGIYAYNSIEWVETLWAVFKLRAVWININYRYVGEELEYIFDYAGLQALVFDRQFADLLNEVHDSIKGISLFVSIDDGSNANFGQLEVSDFEASMADQSTQRNFAPRSNDDIYMLFTGGTTGMPKGVVWRHEDVFFALGGVDPMTSEPVASSQEVIDRGRDNAACFMGIAPLMHGATQWGVMGGAFEGRKIVLMRQFDPENVWQLIESEQVNVVMITGDAMGRPMIEAYQRAHDEKGDTPYDTSSLFLLVSSAAIFTASVKDEYFKMFPDLMISDSIGSSETGSNGMVLVGKDNTAMKAGGPTVKPGRGVAVLDEETLQPLAAGSKKVGKLAVGGFLPLRYHNAPEKSAETFITAADGKRYAMPGDNAIHEADGTITMLGRGSVSINSGGEKIYPEEVEAAVKSHPSVFDCVVVGVPDERWGNRVAVVVQARDGMTVELEDIQTHTRKKIAGYKIPRQLNTVDEVVRAPSGKPDYRWAKSVAAPEA